MSHNTLESDHAARADQIKYLADTVETLAVEHSAYMKVQSRRDDFQTRRIIKLEKALRLARKEIAAHRAGVMGKRLMLPLAFDKELWGVLDKIGEL